MAPIPRGLRYNDGKPRVELLDPEALTGLAEVLTEGARKYADRNWELGMEWSKPYASLLRHLFKFWSGEDIDAESGLRHVDHIACNAHFLQVYARRHQELDDRPKRGPRAGAVCAGEEGGATHAQNTTSAPSDRESLPDCDQTVKTLTGPVAKSLCVRWIGKNCYVRV